MKFQWRSLEYKNKLVILCSLANFINSADRVIMPLAIVPMAAEFNWSLSQQGWILSAFAFGYFSSQIFGANAANKYGGSFVLFLAVTCWSVSTMVTVLCAQYFPLLILARVFLGLGEGLGLPAIFYMFAEHIPVDHRSRAFGYLLAAGSAGQILASVMAPHFKWFYSFELLGLLGLLWALCWKLTIHESNVTSDEEKQLIEEENETETIANLHWFSHWSYWAIYIAHFSMNWSNYIVMQWFPTYLSTTLAVDKSRLSLTAVPYVVSTFCGIFWGHMADELISHEISVLKVRRLMTALGLLGPAICLLILSEVTSLWLSIVIISISMGLCAANSSGHLSNHADISSKNAGITFAISNTIATIPGILCGPVTAGLVLTSHGRWFPVFILAAVINATGSIIYITQSSSNPIL